MLHITLPSKTMRPISLALQLLCSSAAFLVAGQTYGLGSNWIIGNSSTTSIQKVSTTFNPGTPPANQTGIGSLVLYPAMSNGTGDFLRCSVESWQDQSWCGGTSDQWCIRTMVFSDGQQYNGPFAPLDANQAVTFTFERYENQSGWTQTASINGITVSQLDYASGPMTLFGVTTECDRDCVMTISPQTYSNTTINLDTIDETWDETAFAGSSIYGTAMTGQQATSVDGISSSEGGQVWNIESITIPAFS